MRETENKMAVTLQWPSIKKKENVRAEFIDENSLSGQNEN